MSKKILFLCLLSFPCSFSYSQELSNFRKKQISLTTDTLQFDTLSIIPSSFFIFFDNNELLPTDFYSIDYIKSTLILQKNSIQKQFKTDSLPTITIQYRVFPYNFSDSIYHKKREDFVFIDKQRQTHTKRYQTDNSDNFFAESSLQKQGSIARGITFGNNQDMVVNSHLDLQMNGQINERFSILANISDKNIPIQAEGNSQQLQEFDRIFIKIYDKRTDILFGDFVLENNTGNYLNINKKAQGASVATQFFETDTGTYQLKTSLSGAVSKGKYARNQFNGIEGVQGPYKLKGAENELYIVVLSGSERVFINGKLMTRGEDIDYTINYNMAELTFTPSQIITKDSRIIVEFEYSDKNYTRFVAASLNKYESKNTKIFLNVFNESDNKNQPLQQQLTDPQKKVLHHVGDSLHLAISPAIYENDTFNNNYVLYKMTDTIVNGLIYDSILVYSTHPDNAKYRASFSLVGENNGNYVQIKSSANGKVFEWKAPHNGQKQGNYQPVTLLIAPKKKQIINTGASIKINENTTIKNEIAVSNNDLNTFSSLHADDNIGFASNFEIENYKTGKDSVRFFQNNINYQFINQNFSSIEHFRSTEFNRDWNLTNNRLQSQEHFVSFNSKFFTQKQNYIEYSAEWLNKTQTINAFRNTVGFLYKVKKIYFNGTGSYLKSNNQINGSNDFLRHNLVFQYDIAPQISAGISERHEINHFYSLKSDSLLANSFRFDEYEVFVKNTDSLPGNFMLSYMRRNDFQGNQAVNSLAQSNFSDNFKFTTSFKQLKNNTLKTTLTYRNLQITDSLMTTQVPQKTILGKAEHQLRLAKGFMMISTLYKVSSELELKQDYEYLEVAQGQGTHKWIDYNNNNIKELNEFEIAVFQDEATFIRVFVPSNNYANTYSATWGENISIVPARIGKQKTGFFKVISKFSENFALQLNQKNSNRIFSPNVNLRINNTDSSIISYERLIRNTFSFQRTNPRFGMDYIYQNNNNRNLMMNGADTKFHAFNGWRIRWKFKNTMTIFNYANIGKHFFSSEFFQSKSYQIYYQNIEVKFQLQLKKENILNTTYFYEVKQNKQNVENATINKASLEYFNKSIENNDLQLKVEFINIAYYDQNNNEILNYNTPVGYAMLESLKPGNNYTWSVLWTRNITQNLQLNINYEARKHKNQNTIHTGLIQIRAIF